MQAASYRSHQRTDRFDFRLKQIGDRELRVEPANGLARSFSVPPPDALIDDATQLLASIRSHERLADPAEKQAQLAIAMNAGKRLWTQTLGVRSGKARAFDPILAWLRNMDRPPVLWVEGTWRWLPWELLRVPADATPSNQECWLGEVAIVSCLVHDFGSRGESVDPDDEISPCFEIGSAFGDGKSELAYVPAEHDMLLELKAKGAPIRILPDLDHEGPQHAIATLKAFLAKPRPVQLLHVAGHHDDRDAANEYRRLHFPMALSRSPDFVVHLRNGVRVTNLDFMDHGFDIAGQAVAFLNVCSAHTPNARSSGGFAENLIRQYGVIAAVASCTEIGDLGASDFSKRFFDLALPSPWGTGLSVGEAAFHARKASLEAGHVTGFCYKVLGANDATLGDQRDCDGKQQTKNLFERAASRIGAGNG